MKLKECGSQERSDELPAGIKLQFLRGDMGNSKPKNCCHPDCFHCPYNDCIYDRLEVEDFSETNDRDYWIYEDSTGKKLHQSKDKDYRNARKTAYNRKAGNHRDRHEYNQKYYAEHGKEIREKRKQNYDTKKNTAKCRKYRKKNKEHEKERQREYYLANREKKQEYARKRYEMMKGELNA